MFTCRTREKSLKRLHRGIRLAQVSTAMHTEPMQTEINILDETCRTMPYSALGPSFPKLQIFFQRAIRWTAHVFTIHPSLTRR